MKDKINVLITGASGTVGFAILKQLCASSSKYNITLFDKKTRKIKRQFGPFRHILTIVYGDISNDDFMQSICKEKHIVIHLAAIIPPLADENPKLAYEVNTIGTRNLIEGLERYSPEAFLFYSSSISVYGDRLKNHSIKVGDLLIPSTGDEYAKTKIEAEEIIQNSKIEWCILRLTAIMGNHKISKLMFHMPLETPMEIATPMDTARAFINAIDHKSLLSRKIYNLGGGVNMRLSYHELLTSSFQIFGLGKVDFPEYSFAKRNFHCGYYSDGDDLEKILNYQQSNLESYFNELHLSISPFRRFITSIFSKWIKKILSKKSEPLKAIIENDSEQITLFFGADYVKSN